MSLSLYKNLELFLYFPRSAAAYLDGSAAAYLITVIIKLSQFKLSLTKTELGNKIQLELAGLIFSLWNEMPHIHYVRNGMDHSIPIVLESMNSSPAGLD